MGHWQKPLPECVTAPLTTHLYMPCSVVMTQVQPLLEQIILRADSQRHRQDCNTATIILCYTVTSPPSPSLCMLLAPAFYLFGWFWFCVCFCSEILLTEWHTLLSLCRNKVGIKQYLWRTYWPLHLLSLCPFPSHPSKDPEAKMFSHWPKDCIVFRASPLLMWEDGHIPLIIYHYNLFSRLL